jgi:hypothetical protein
VIYSGDETCAVVYDSGTPAGEDDTSKSSHFNGRVKWVQLDAGSTTATTSSAPRSVFASPRQSIEMITDVSSPRPSPLVRDPR